jgi:Na+-driven multidrug efflux pump
MAKIHSKVTQKLGIIVAVIMATLVVIFHKELLSLFTNDLTVIETGRIPLIILAVTILFQVPQVIIVGALRGAGDVKFVALLMLISVTFVRPIMAWLLIYPLGFGLIGAWIALFIDQITRNTISLWRFKQDRWSKIIV